MNLEQQIKACIDRLKEIDDEQAKIEKAAEADNGGRFTDEQRAEWDKLNEEHAAKTEELATLKADLKRQNDRASRRAIDTAVPRRTAADVGANVQPPNSDRNDGVTSQRLAAEDDPKKGFSDHREFFSAVMEAGHTNRVDERLALCQSDRNAAAGSDEAGTYGNPVGGYLIPKGFSPNLLSVMAENDPIASRTTQIPMESAIVDIPARVDKNHSTSVSGGLRVYRRAETDTSASSRIEFEQVTLRAHGLFGLAYATEEILERSPNSFVALLDAGFRDEFTAKLIDERLNGSGVGMMEGVLSSPALVSVAKETGQAADTIVYENVIKMRSRCWGYNNAVWLANHDCMPQLMLLSQAVGTGGIPVWQPSAREDYPDLLLGRPLFFTEFTETVGDQGDIVLGNWSQYLEGTLTGMNSAESVHVRFINHERTFKFWMENDGRCWWRSALTPRKSATTLSPYVVLAARA